MGKSIQAYVVFFTHRLLTASAQQKLLIHYKPALRLAALFAIIRSIDVRYRFDFPQYEALFLNAATIYRKISALPFLMKWLFCFVAAHKSANSLTIMQKARQIWRAFYWFVGYHVMASRVSRSSASRAASISDFSCQLCAYCWLTWAWAASARASISLAVSS